MSQYGVQSFKPIEKGTIQNSKKNIKIRENIRQIPENFQEEEDNRQISSPNYLEEINEIGIVYLDQNAYDFFDQSESIKSQSKEKLV